MSIGQEEVITGGKIVGMITASGIMVIRFFGRFQTKKGCRDAHIQKDLLEAAEQVTRDEQRANMLKTLNRIEDTVMHMAKDLYRPSTLKERTNDRA